MTEQTTTHEAAKDAEVLAGVLNPPKAETKTDAPPRRSRRAASAKPATETTTAKTPATAPAGRKAQTGKPKTATAKTPAKAAATGVRTPAKGRTPAAKANATPTPKAEQNGSATSAREGNQVLARELIDLVAGHFAGHSKADQEKIANWLKVLPTGGAAWQRYWPAKFARPTTSDWRKPE